MKVMITSFVNEFSVFFVSLPVPCSPPSVDVLVIMVFPHDLLFFNDDDNLYVIMCYTFFFLFFLMMVIFMSSIWYLVFLSLADNFYCTQKRNELRRDSIKNFFLK